MAKKGKPKLAVVRGVQPRMMEMNFYSFFKKMDVSFYGDKKTSSSWINNKTIPKNVKCFDLPLKPLWGFDPITTILGPLHAHRGWQITAGLEKHLKEADMINISDLFYFYCGQSARLAKKLNKKLMAIVWETVPKHLSTYLPPYCFNVHGVLKQADLFVARSHKAKEYLLSIGADPKKIKVIYKGVDTQKTFVPKKRKPDGKIRLLTVAQLVKSKGIVELLQAFKRLSGEFPNLELWLLGRSKGEPMEKRARRLAKKLPIVVKSQVPYHQVPKLYQEADIYCHLSQDWKYLGLITGGNDWFPYAVIEAMACGLPVVTTGVGGISEQVGPDNVIVEQKNVKSTCQGIKKMIENEQLREKVGLANRKRAVKMFEIKTQARKTEKAALEFLKKP